MMKIYLNYLKKPGIKVIKQTYMKLLYLTNSFMLNH